MIDLLIQEIGETIIGDNSVAQVNVAGSTDQPLQIASGGQNFAFFDALDNITIVGFGLYVNHNLQIVEPSQITLGLFLNPTDYANPGTVTPLDNFSAEGSLNIPKAGVLYNIRNYLDMVAYEGVIVTARFMVSALINTADISMAYTPNILNGVSINTRIAVLIEHTLPLHALVS